MRYWLALWMAVCALATAAAGQTPGRRAPGFSLPESSRKLVDLQDYRGKVVLIDFMQASCPHCATFSKILEQAKAKYGDRIAIISIVNPPSDPPAVTKYIAENKVTTPILFDCGQVAYSYLLPKTNSINVPHLFIVDGDGMIRSDFGYGPQTREIFEGKGLGAEIDKVLAAKPGARR